MSATVYRLEPDECARHLCIYLHPRLPFRLTSFTLAFRAFRLAGLAVGLGLSAALSIYQRSQAQMASREGHDGHLDATSDREVVFCHACSYEWYRDSHGLMCPHCESEITEIVSILTY